MEKGLSSTDDVGRIAWSDLKRKQISANPWKLVGVFKREDRKAISVLGNKMYQVTEV